MLCLRGFELYSRWMPLRSFTSGKFYVKSSRIEIQNKTFKRVLRKLLFDILDEDNYNQIPVVIKKSAYVDRYTCEIFNFYFSFSLLFIFTRDSLS